ncbi:MAG TPA: ABC transporter permease [Chitinophagaceae bacterium]|nr:ABC transporter permease [Chitinophagaceae bacterium]
MSQNHSVGESWDLEIKPRANFFDLNLKEIWRYRDLLLLFVRRDFVAQYKQTILGPLWHIIQPVFTTIVFLIVFNGFANIGTGNVPPILFYISSIAIWNYFAACFTTTSATFINNASIFGKVYFPRLILPLSVIISNLFRFFIQLILVIVMIVYWTMFKGYRLPVTALWLYIPLFAILMGLMGLGLGIIISSLTTKYRDFTILITFGVQLLMYVTPIAYPLSFLQNKNYAWIGTINPLTPVVEGFRHILFDTTDYNYYSLVYSILFTIAVLMGGILIFHRVEKTFMDTV